MNETNLQNIASDGLFHQIALVSVKPLLTTIIHELRESSDRNIPHVMSWKYAVCMYLLSFTRPCAIVVHRTRLLVSADIATGASLKAKVHCTYCGYRLRNLSHVELDIYLWCM